MLAAALAAAMLGVPTALSTPAALAADSGVAAPAVAPASATPRAEEPPPNERAPRVPEAPDLGDAPWTSPEARDMVGYRLSTYTGKYYKLDRGNCDPKPVQKPHPPLFQPFASSENSIRWCAQEGVTAVLPPMHATWRGR